MILTQVKKNNADGSFDTIWKFTSEQVEVLLNIAVQILIAKGLATVVDEVVDKDEVRVDSSILEMLNKEDLPRA